MKKIFTLSLCLLFLCNLAYAQTCGVGGLTFSTQASIDNFSTNNPGCTQVLGPVTISGANITNLNGLSAIATIDGSLTIQNNPLLTSLNGLGGLTDILQGVAFGQLLINNNPGLVNLSGLGALKTIHHFLSVEQCNALTSLSGLTALETIGEGVSVRGCPLLKDLKGLEAITALNAVVIGEDAGLTSLEGLESLTFLGGIQDFAGMSNYSAVSAITALPYGLDITGSGGFTGLENVVSIGGNCTFSFCSNLSGLPALRTIGGTLALLNCSVSNLNAFYALESIGGLDIQNNLNLSQCAIQSICRLLADDPGAVTISNNATGCNTYTQVSSSQECPGYIAPSFITNFSGNKSGSNILLSWQTSAETGVLEYAVERSTSVAGFTQIGIVPSQGNSAGIQNYGFTDTNSNLDNYYRLKQKNIDASFSYSDIIYVQGNAPVCPTSDLILNTQAQVNNFATLYPECNILDHSLSVVGTGITNLQGLIGIKEIHGRLSISDCRSLTSLSGLDSLRAIYLDPNNSNPLFKYGLYLNNLVSLTNFSGLEKLRIVEGWLDVWNGTALNNISAIQGMTKVGRLMLHATALTDMSGAPDAAAIAEFRIADNLKLTSLQGLTSKNRWAEISLLRNPVLHDISALSGVTRIDYLQLSNNPLLLDLLPLASLDSVGFMSYFQMKGSNLDFFANVDPTFLTDLSMSSSPNLVGCQVKSVCNFLATTNRFVTFSGNGAGCNSKAEILASEACLVVFPVDFISFTSKTSPEGNKLTWSTATEVSNRGFDIEGSADARVFTKIGFVEGNGNTNRERKYSFTDSAPFPTTYYRLKQWDFNGDFEYSSIIVHRTGDETAKVYPNPSRGTLHIESKNQNQPYSIKNIQGFSVMESSVLPSKPLDTSSLQNGLYLITVGKDVFKVAVQN